MSTTFDLTNRNVLVVGGSSGMGLETARLAACQGANVTIASRSVDKLEKARESLGTQVSMLRLDVTEEAAVAGAFEGHSFDHVVFTGAVGGLGLVSDMTLDTAMDAFRNKFFGAFLLAKHARLPAGGSLSFVSGLWSARPSAGVAMMSAVNAAVEALARTLALEMAPARVNAVCPAVVDTPLYDSMPEAERKALFAKTAATLPVGRVGHAGDVAQAMVYLMCNSFVTGTVLYVDGGASLV